MLVRSVVKSEDMCVLIVGSQGQPANNSCTICRFSFPVKEIFLQSSSASSDHQIMPIKPRADCSLLTQLLAGMEFDWDS